MNCWTGTITWVIAARSVCTCATPSSTGHGRWLGCLLFAYAARSLPCRDQFIGWDEAARQRASGPGHREQPLPDLPVGAGRESGIEGAVVGGASAGGRLAGAVRLPPRAGGDLCRSEPVPWQLLPSGKLAVSRRDPGQGVGANAERRFRPPVG